MGLLDGNLLQSVFGAALRPIYASGTLHVGTFVDNGKGGGSITFSDFDIYVQKESYTERYRTELHLSEKDVRFIILQEGNAVLVPPLADDEITYKGDRYTVAAIEGEDPAQAAWWVRAHPNG